MTRGWLLGTGLLALLLAQSLSAQAPAPVFLGLQPGQSSRAQVELLLGLPVTPAADNTPADKPATDNPPTTPLFEYQAPVGANDIAKVVASYAADEPLLLRLDIHLKTPLPAASLRERFGTPVLRRAVADGRREELFHPSLQALVSGDDPEVAIAIGFLSSRWLADQFCDRFNAHLLKDALADAAIEADKALLIAPDYARAHLAKGVWLHESGRHAEALDRYLQAVAQPFGRNSRALAYTYAGELTWLELQRPAAEVESYFRQALSLDPELARAHWQYGHFLLQHKRDREARQALDTAFRLRPGYLVNLRQDADQLYDSKRFADAEAQLGVLADWLGTADGATASSEFREHVLFRHAYVLGELKQYPLARDGYRKLLALAPRDGSAHNNLGTVLWELGDLAGAETSYRRAIESKSENFIAQRNLARLLLVRQRPKEALAAAEQAHRLKADDADTLLMLARANAALGKNKLALDWLEQAVAAGYRNGKALRGYREFAGLAEKRRFKQLLQPLGAGD